MYVWRYCADYCTTSKEWTRKGSRQNEKPCTEVVPSETGGVRESVYNDTEEAQFSLKKGCKSQVNDRDGSDRIYTRRRTQSAGTLNCDDTGREGERPSGCPIPYYKRYAGFDGSFREKTGKIKVRVKATQIERAYHAKKTSRRKKRDFT